MMISKGIVYIMALFMIAGGLDKIAGNRFGILEIRVSILVSTTVSITDL